MDLLVVVLAKFLLFLSGESTEWFGDITVGILAADHEADLAGWIGGNGGVGIFYSREDLLAVLLKLGNQWEVEPLVFGYNILA